VIEIPHEGSGVEVGNRRDAQTSHSCFDSSRGLFTGVCDGFP
jgi:hypothetical protein